jgi:hypothetical protein
MQQDQKIRKAGEVCDFCNATPVVKVYDAAPIAFAFASASAPPVVQVCDTKWTACSICAEFIDQDRWIDLTDRTMETWLAEQRSRGVHIGYREREEIKQEMRRMHASFREAKGRTA